MRRRGAPGGWSPAQSLLWAIICVAPWATGCQDHPATQAMVSVVTDLEPEALERVTMKLERLNEGAGDYAPLQTYDWPIKSGGLFELPGSVVAYSTGQEPPQIRITLSAWGPEQQLLVSRRAVFRLVHQRAVFLRLGLTSRCLGDADCADSTTCIEGRCRDEVIDGTQLSAYQAAATPERAFACDSGTSFRNTITGAALPPTSKSCPGPDQVCSEGTCYSPRVFARDGLPPGGPVTVNAQVGDPSGLPLVGAKLRLEDGPVTLVRALRGEANTDGGEEAGDNPSEADAMTPGLYRVRGTADRLTRDLRLTVTAPGHAPQVINVPYKANVEEYLVPVVLFPLAERTIGASAAAGPGRVLEVTGPGGRSATLTVGGTEALRVRYALVEARLAPGQGMAGAPGRLLQSSAVLYLENVAGPTFPEGTTVALGLGDVAPLVGAQGGEGGLSAFALDLQGQWRLRTEARVEGTLAPEPNGMGFKPLSNGFWTVARPTAQPACVRGKATRPDGKPCAGARVRLVGPEGVSSFDTVGADGSFCGSVAQQEATVVAIGNTSRMIHQPAVMGMGLHCGQPDACRYVGELIVDDEQDCTAAPRVALSTQSPAP
jgi:hypothetical protein